MDFIKDPVENTPWNRVINLGEDHYPEYPEPTQAEIEMMEQDDR